MQVQKQGVTWTDGKLLKIEGELAPATPADHDKLVVLLDENVPPKTEVEFWTDNNIVHFALTFEVPRKTKKAAAEGSKD